MTRLRQALYAVAVVVGLVAFAAMIGVAGHLIAGPQHLRKFADHETAMLGVIDVR